MFEQDFEAMLRKYENDIYDKKRFTGLVKDHFPEQAKNINLLLMAYNMGIAQEIQSVQRINNAFAFRFVKQLMDDYGISRVNADWVISTWCVCYGKNILGRVCEIRLQEKEKGPAIQEEKNPTQKYGDLFQYRKSMQGNGLGVCGFLGENKHSIIFQNNAMAQPVIEICDNSFQGLDIEEAILIDGYQHVGAGAFSDCIKLHQIVLPVTVKEISDSAFKNCVSLKSVSLPINLERLGDSAFRGTGLRTIRIPKSLYWIGDYVFADCKEIDNVEIPANIERITEGMFQNCSSLKKVLLTDGLNRIEQSAFEGCSSLDMITIPDSVHFIGERAFEGTDKMFIIQCTLGSCAEEYARKNKLKYQLI